MAAIWKGSISFGLVSIPVELRTAVRDNRPSFRLLHVKDKSPVKYERVCQREGHAVAWDDLVKGYEYKKNHFVVLTKDDFQTAALERSRSVEIVDFVDPAEIDDRFFETSYFAVPQSGGERGYAVLREAMRASNKVGIGKMVMRQAQHLVALEVVEQALVLTRMRYADELVDVSDYKLPGAKDVRPKELEMARMLVESLSAKWQPDQYTDDYRANLLKIINAKLKGKEVTVTLDEEPRSAEVIDLMERLQKSLASNKKGRSASTPKRAAATRKRKPRQAA